MTLTRIIVVALFLCSCSEENNPKIEQIPKPVTIKNINALPDNFSLKYVEKIFGSFSVCHGGGIIWYKSSDDPQSEFWFYLSPIGNPSESNGESEYTYEQLKVIYITVVKKEDPDSQKFVWPSSAINLDVAKTTRKLFLNNQKQIRRKGKGETSP